MTVFVPLRLRAFGRRARRAMLTGAAVVIPASTLLSAPLSAVAAPATRPATDVFTGTATSGNVPVDCSKAPAPLQPVAMSFEPVLKQVQTQLPVNIDCAGIGVSAEGAVAVPYTYVANGTASGDIRGDFGYVEHGALVFSATGMAGRLQSAAFTLQPNRRGSAPIVIQDTDPSSYQSGVKTVGAPELAAAVARANKVLGRITDTRATHGALTYGWFTFTDHYGTFTGIATPDFRKFKIKITFGAPTRDQ